MTTDITGYRAVASQDAGTVSGFKLEQADGCQCWDWVLASTDVSNPSQVDVRGPAAANAWVHLVGVYDSTAAKITLSINGSAAGSAAFGARTWNATGPLTIGRTKWQGNPSDWFKGDISDLQVYQRALTPAEVQATYSYATVTVTPLGPGPHTLYVHAA